MSVFLFFRGVGCKGTTVELEPTNDGLLVRAADDNGEGDHVIPWEDELIELIRAKTLPSSKSSKRSGAIKKR